MADRYQASGRSGWAASRSGTSMRPTVANGIPGWDIAVEALPISRAGSNLPFFLQLHTFGSGTHLVRQ
jgi:hypothetical protein